MTHEIFTPRPAHLPYRDGVGVVAINPEGLVLVGKSRGFEGIWKMPQGGIETGEIPELAALRELKEEAGITRAQIVTKTKAAYSYDYAEGDRYMPGFKGQEFQWFQAKVKQTHIDPQRFTPPGEDQEFSTLRWVTPQQAITLAHNEFGGDAVTLQRQAMYSKVFTEFGMLPQEPAPRDVPKRQVQKSRPNRRDAKP